MARGVDLEFQTITCDTCGDVPMVKPCEHEAATAKDTLGQRRFPPSDESIKRYFTPVELEQLNDGTFQGIEHIPEIVIEIARLLVAKNRENSSNTN